MRVATLNAFVFLFLTAALDAQGEFGARDLNRRGDSVKRLQLWVNAVQSHRDGMPDEGSHLVTGWTQAELDDLMIDLRSLLRLMEQPRGTVFSVWFGDGRNSGRRRVVYSRSELDRLRSMARAAGGLEPNATPSLADEGRVAPARNRLIKRGAVLHTTIALNRPEHTDARPANPFVTQWEGVIQFDDGRQVGLDGRANQWEFARRLLDLVTPHPSRHSAVRDWYRASCATLLAHLQLHGDHFDQAVRLFPDDPLLLMFAGGFHEALSSAGVQAFIRSAVLPKGVTLRFGSTRTELSRAEPLYKRAVTLDPGAAEARVRLGRVLSLQGRYSDAVGEFRRLDASTPPILQYYGTLFEGEAAEGLGQLDEARAAYERAADLYPLAQKPRLALSHLAMRTGNSTAAAAAIAHVLSTATEPELDDDPFWTYYSAAGRDADVLLAQAYRALLTEAAR